MNSLLPISNGLAALPVGASTSGDDSSSTEQETVENPVAQESAQNVLAPQPAQADPVQQVNRFVV